MTTDLFLMETGNVMSPQRPTIGTSGMLYVIKAGHINAAMMKTFIMLISRSAKKIKIMKVACPVYVYPIDWGLVDRVMSF